MTKQELAELSGVSVSFLSDLTTGKANPSLKVMESIANALNVPLTFLLESTDLDKETLAKLISMTRRLPKGYERVWAVLPEHKAFIVKKWSDETQIKLKEDIRKKSRVLDFHKDSSI